MGYTDDGFPYVGTIPGKPGQFVIAGFSGHGMPQAFLSAKAVASMIADGTKMEDAGTRLTASESADFESFTDVSACDCPDLPKLYRSTSERFDAKQEHTSITAFNAAMQKLGLNN